MTAEVPTEAALRVSVAFLGHISATGRRMCMAACRDSGFLPGTVVGLGANNAIVSERGHGSVMYVRWAGNYKRMRPSWTFDPNLFGRGWGKRSQRRMHEVLVDPATTKSVISYRWKLAKLV